MSACGHVHGNKVLQQTSTVLRDARKEGILCFEAKKNALWSKTLGSGFWSVQFIAFFFFFHCADSCGK